MVGGAKPVRVKGEIKVEMQFMADIFLDCESCHGKRFKQEVLEVQHKGANIFEILDMTVENALEYFSKTRNLFTKKFFRFTKLD
jgi:excinuclease ABC subunit A